MKISIATPMYGGNSKSEYVLSMQELRKDLEENGYQVDYLFMTNESLVTRARNTLAHQFLKSDSDALLFIDADHGFSSKDVLKMIESGKDVIGGIYPIKTINWENVRKAALAGVPADQLEFYSGLFVINFLNGETTFNIDEPFKVRDIGTGMMFIHRRAFEQVRPLVKKYKYDINSNSLIRGEVIYEFFPTLITEEPESTLLSEDYAFCHLYRESGGDVWAAPWVRISHTGDHLYRGSFIASAELSMLPE